jgi:hypothetical protein
MTRRSGLRPRRVAAALALRHDGALRVASGDAADVRRRLHQLLSRSRPRLTARHSGCFQRLTISLRAPVTSVGAIRRVRILRVVRIARVDIHVVHAHHVTIGQGELLLSGLPLVVVRATMRSPAPVLSPALLVSSIWPRFTRSSRTRRDRAGAKRIGRWRHLDLARQFRASPSDARLDARYATRCDSDRAPRRLARVSVRCLGRVRRAARTRGSNGENDVGAGLRSYLGGAADVTALATVDLPIPSCLATCRCGTPSATSRRISGPIFH